MITTDASVTLLQNKSETEEIIYCKNSDFSVLMMVPPFYTQAIRKMLQVGTATYANGFGSINLLAMLDVQTQHFMSPLFTLLFILASCYKLAIQIFKTGKNPL